MTNDDGVGEEGIMLLEWISTVVLGDEDECHHVLAHQRYTR